MLSIHCGQCGKEYPLATREWRCVRCGGLLEIDGAAPFDLASVNRFAGSLWRYREMLPLPPGGEPISMGEGWTPLLRLASEEDRVYVKCDFLMPSGSFKDRGETVLVSALKTLEIDDLVEDSSGNAAASLAAYTARAGLNARLYVPGGNTSRKLSQTRAYGARVVPVEGPRENAARAAQEAVVSSGAYYASHTFNPFFLAGMQTTAWELWEQLGGQVPDNLIMPVGNGSYLVGVYRGWLALRDAGLISRLPRLFGIQAANVAPLALAFDQGQNEPAVIQPHPTIAEGISVAEPVRGRQILDAVRETAGAVIAVREEEIVQAQIGLAHQGQLVEPTSATAYAALGKIPRRNGVTVIALTGSGLKSM